MFSIVFYKNLLVIKFLNFLLNFEIERSYEDLEIVENSTNFSKRLSCKIFKLHIDIFIYFDSEENSCSNIIKNNYL